MKHQIKQRGFTLIELLVVVAIMGTLLGLVAISNRPSRKTQLRMAAQSVASLVVAAQSNALDSEVGSALWISSDGVYDANPRQNIVLSVGSVNKIPSNATSPTQFGLGGSIVPKEPIPSSRPRAGLFRSSTDRFRRLVGSRGVFDRRKCDRNIIPQDFQSSSISAQHNLARKILRYSQFASV